jgi:phenylpropionate dioxygenase-like ring-hydroxylating dioxygenase large terminal subunit
VSKDLEPAALDQWYVIESSEDLRSDQPRRTRLLGRPILGERSASGTVTVEERTEEGETLRKLPCLERYGYVWATLGAPAKPLFDMPEFEEDGRRLVVCGVLTVRTSPGRPTSSGPSR